jgi:pimeloyl-ACP methyl ester carboxylesterase
MPMEVFTTRDGVALHYERRSSGPGQMPIVFIHGLGSNHTRWSEFWRETRLSERHDLIRLDLRGHGLSRTRLPITLAHFTQDIVSLLDHLQHSRAILMGHCLGANIALRFHQLQPHRLSGMVLIEPFFYPAMRRSFRYAARMTLPVVRLLKRGADRLNRMGLARRRFKDKDLYLYDRESRGRLTARGLERMRYWVRYLGPWRDMESMPTAAYLQSYLSLFEPLPDPAGIACPTLLLLSEAALFGDVRRMFSFPQPKPHITVRTIACDHWVLTERPVESRELIEEWLQSLLPVT